MKNRKIIVGVGIVIFFVLVIYWCGGHNLSNFIDFDSFIGVTVGGCALAFAKTPKSVNDFLKYFSKTSLLTGVLGTFIGFINMFKSIDFEGDLFGIGIGISVALITTFYGLIFSAISYALYRDEPK